MRGAGTPTYRQTPRKIADCIGRSILCLREELNLCWGGLPAHPPYLMCHRQDSNLRPGAYETPALPLSYGDVVWAGENPSPCLPPACR